MEPSIISSPPSASPKKGLGTGAKIGIGCGALVLIVIVGLVIASFLAAPKLKQLLDDAQKNPTRTTASVMVSTSGGTIEMVAEDDVNLRYTVKDKQSGKLTTIYWSEAKKATDVIAGDFSAIPSTVLPAAPPAPEAEKE